MTIGRIIFSFCILGVVGIIFLAISAPDNDNSGIAIFYYSVIAISFLIVILKRLFK